VRFLPDDLPADVSAFVRSRTVSRRYRHGDVLAFQGDPSASVFTIESGHAAVSVGTESGDHVTVTILGPGDSFGEMSGIIGSGSRTATVTALDDVEASILPHADFAHIRSLHPAVDRALVVALARRVEGLGERLTQTLYESVGRRCARRLLESAELFADGDSATVPITQEDLAGMTGATRPTVNQVLARLGDDGIVRLARGRIVVTSIDRLRAFVR
jgi:CRP-like cAMP-binding protein